MDIGDYVRTKNKTFRPTQIAKISSMAKDEGYKNQYFICLDHNLLNDYEYQIYEEDIENSSPNIIDLIEVGDYVNGHKVVEVDLDDIDDYGNDFRYITTEYDFTLNHWIKENEIESVLTKEQFESMEYKIGDKENE